MPEIAEVRTVARTLNERLHGRKIKDVKIIYSNILLDSNEEFISKVVGKTIECVDNYGKWIFISLGEYTIMSHLRMEGKYFIKDTNEVVDKHEHIIFNLDNDTDLRYHDTRKFGRMRIVPTNEIYKTDEISKLGIEPDSPALTAPYLKHMIENKKLPIKTLLLDQSIINGLGNIYVDEVLFRAKVHPETIGSKITLKNCENIIEASRDIIERATLAGGTTIRSYTSSLNVYGTYQKHLKVHTKENENCPECNTKIEKIRVGGRGTYFCPKCQKLK